MERGRVFYRAMRALADLVREENGRASDEARTAVAKAVELPEFAGSLPQLIQNKFLKVSKGVETRADRKPLGVVAGDVSPEFNDKQAGGRHQWVPAPAAALGKERYKTLLGTARALGAA